MSIKNHFLENFGVLHQSEMQGIPKHYTDIDLKGTGQLKSPYEKLNHLKNDLQKMGFRLEDGKDGEIRMFL